MFDKIKKYIGIIFCGHIILDNMPAQNNYPLYKEDDREYLFLTITYKQDPNIGVRTPCGLKDQFNSTVKEILTQLETCSDYILVPEFTLNSRIHYHAIIKVKPRCRVKYYKMMHYYKSLGFCSATKVVNLQNVNEYIHKDVDVMMDILGISLPLYSGHSAATSSKVYFE